MGNELTSGAARGVAATTSWFADCKDCVAERAARNRSRAKDGSSEFVSDPVFEYPDAWAQRTIERGGSRSDRCQRHRQAHRRAIQALPVAYIDLTTIGEVADRKRPSGPLGGLGPLPTRHKSEIHEVDLSQFRMGLSDEDMLQLLRGLSQKQVAVVEAGTGTGKSTLMPFRLMNPPPGAAIHLNDFGPIVVTQPRKAAATGLSAFVGEAICFGHDPAVCNEHVGPGFPVGHQVRGDRNWDAACQLVYVTDGTMINWVREGRLASIGTVIIDEVHERSENIDIILAQLRDNVKRYAHLRVIVTSATLDKDFFIEYFGGPSEVYHQYVEAQKSFGYGVPLFIGAEISDDVIENGLPIDTDPALAAGDDVGSFEGWAKRGPETSGQPAEDLRATTRELLGLRRAGEIPIENWKDDMPAAVVEQVIQIAAATEYGDILAFLPTSEVIKATVSKIRAGLETRGMEFDVYPLLASTQNDVRDKALEARSRGDRRKIVVSSNLAETSLTVMGVRYVVDSGLICQPDWDPGLASGSFPTKPHSQSGVRQRWGRVGRDSPGWVFPLYTLEQFRSLPRSTPPGSTQTNLENFYMKLISAGIDGDDLVLPSNFTHERVNYDADGLRNIETFNRESERAIRALASSGAIDHDGHLTDFGSELERFPGSGAHAMAIMLADQLACVHEVALALTVLGGDGLVGKKDQLLRVGPEWPAGWRVHAWRCHRALAVGCVDDLDIVLRVFSEWEAAEDPAAWCARWWVNESALENAKAGIEQIIAPLSGGMKADAARPVMAALAGRARAVITRTMGSLSYERINGARFSRSGKDDDDVVELSRSTLVADPGERIIALNSFRRPHREGRETQAPIISDCIRIVNWAVDSEMTSNSMGIDFIIRATHQLRDQAGKLIAAGDSLSDVREEFPIGSIIDLELGEKKFIGRAINSCTHVAGPFAFRGDPVETTTELAGRRTAASGFDPDWDPHSSTDPVIPEEEAALQLVDVHNAETNDAPISDTLTAEQPIETDLVLEGRAAGMPGIVVISAHDADEIDERARVEIVGYRILDDATAALVVEVRADDSEEVDPAEHRDLDYWDEVELEVRGTVEDHETDWVQLARVDGHGSFYLHMRSRGVAATDLEFAGRLQRGAHCIANVVPDRRSGTTITLLPSSIEHLRASPSEQARDGSKLYPATVVEPPTIQGWIAVELDHRDETRGLIYRFGVRKEELERWDNLAPDVGQRLLVAISRDRTRSRETLSLDVPEMAALVEEHGNHLRIAGDRVRAADSDLSLALIRNLLNLKGGDVWERTVWRFHLDNLHLVATRVRPIMSRLRLDAPAPTRALLAAQKNEIGERHRVFISLDRKTSEFEIAGLNPQAVESAKQEMQAIADLPYAVAMLPQKSIGRVYGKGHSDIRRLRDRAGVYFVEIDDRAFTVAVVADTSRHVRETVKAIEKLAAGGMTLGEMVVPAGMNGRIIGTKGATIRLITQATSCRADRINNGHRWKVMGPSESAVRAFFQMAADRVPGTTGKIIPPPALTIIDKRTRAPSRRSSPRKLGENVAAAARKLAGEGSSTKKRSASFLHRIASAVRTILGSTKGE